MKEKFDKIYFEDGVKNKISGYENYRWRPEYVLPLANWLKQKFGNGEPYVDGNRTTKYLDYGCAKGFLVKALRLLDCDAYGFDISEYAIKNGETEVEQYLSNTNIVSSEVVIMKDVLEHIPKEILEYSELDFAKKYIVAIIPLGDNGKFRIREYELDITHVTKEDEVWWINYFYTKGFICEEFYYSIDGIKDNWTKNFPYGNGIFIFKRKE